ncbi:hypothetical protein, partial [Mesorhizobium sp. M1403]|uniref:hypothetical protein n=1 Tax=Mesorhizobium sp. M1403 TaxID=2957097 RepID=UPI0033350765
SFAQLPLQRILSQPKLNPKIAICDSPALVGEMSGRTEGREGSQACVFYVFPTGFAQPEFA